MFGEREINWMHCKECSLSSRNHLDPLYLTNTNSVLEPLIFLFFETCEEGSHFDRQIFRQFFKGPGNVILPKDTAFALAVVEAATLKNMKFDK